MHLAFHSGEAMALGSSDHQIVLDSIMAKRRALLVPFWAENLFSCSSRYLVSKAQLLVGGGNFLILPT